MHALIHSVRSHRKFWLILTIALTLLTGGMVARSGQCLKTVSTPYGIVSLELAVNQVKADAIRQIWQITTCQESNNLISIAKFNIAEDLLFVMAYTLLMIVCIILLDRGRNPNIDVSHKTKALMFIAILPGILDVIENFFMWKFLEGDIIYSFMFAVPAAAKFFIVLSLILYVAFELYKRYGKNISLKR